MGKCKAPEETFVSFRRPGTETLSGKVRRFLFNRYREVGLSLIPLKPGEKRPLESNWQVFCDRLPTDEECEKWERLGHKSYGLALGPASGIMAVDVDSDDVRVLSAVKASPVRKRGKKGDTRFFRFDPNVPSTKIAGCIDILAYGRQTVLPPTIHPDTGKPYLWLTLDTIDGYPKTDLPLFTVDDLNELRFALGEGADSGPATAVEIGGGPFYNDDPKRQSPHGSQDRLKTICHAMIARGSSPDEVVRELLKYDDENHKPIGYFSEFKRTSDQKYDSPVMNALTFYMNNLKSAYPKSLIVPAIPGAEPILEVNLKESIAAAPVNAVAWPEPQGTLKDIRDIIFQSSMRDQPGIALGGAVALGSVLISNRIRMDDVWPNVYVLNVGRTGAGKSFPHTAIKRLLTPENDLDLIGSGGYRSSAAMIKDLMSKRERLDVIDECSDLFRTMRDGGVFQQDMMAIFNSLWSDSNTSFLGPEAVGREKIQVWHACVSTLFSTTPQGLKGSINSSFVAQGLLPRCLIFNDADYGPIKSSAWNVELAERVVAKASQMRAQFGQKDAPGKRNMMMGPKPNPDAIDVTADARARLAAYQRECAEALSEPDREEVERHFLSRGGQQAARLALIHGALWRLTVGIEDVEWAIATLAACRHNATDLLPTLGAENAQETNVIKVFQKIKRVGSITQSALYNQTRFLRTRERQEILDALVMEGKICLKTRASGSAGRPEKIWMIL